MGQTGYPTRPLEPITNTNGGYPVDKRLRKIVGTTLIISLVIMVLAGCGGAGPKPTGTVEGFYAALRDGELTEAATYLEEGASLEAFEFDDPTEEGIIKALFAELTFEPDDKVSVEGDEATVTGKVTSVDLVAVVMQTMTEMLPTLFALAFSDEEEVDTDALVEKAFLDAIADPDAPKSTTEMSIKLRRVEGKWLIATGENPLSFLTDGLDGLEDLFETE